MSSADGFDAALWVLLVHAVFVAAAVLASVRVQDDHADDAHDHEQGRKKRDPTTGCRRGRLKSGYFTKIFPARCPAYYACSNDNVTATIVSGLLDLVAQNRVRAKAVLLDKEKVHEFNGHAARDARDEVANADQPGDELSVLDFGVFTIF